MEEAKEFGFQYMKDNICYDDVVRKLVDAYYLWFEKDQERSNNEDIKRIAEEQGIDEGDVRQGVEDGIREFIEKYIYDLGEVM